MQWDEYFMNIAEQVALKSKDPSTKTGPFGPVSVC